MPTTRPAFGVISVLRAWRAPHGPRTSAATQRVPSLASSRNRSDIPSSFLHSEHPPSPASWTSFLLKSSPGELPWAQVHEHSIKLREEVHVRRSSNHVHFERTPRPWLPCLGISGGFILSQAFDIDSNYFVLCLSYEAAQKCY